MEYSVEILISVLSAIFVTILSYAIIYSLKPKLDFNCILINDKSIRVNVTNRGRFSAVNVRIEICALDQPKGYTYHFDVDQSEFLIIPSKKLGRDNSKIFKVIGFTPSIETEDESYESLMDKVKKNQYKLRVRIHGYHSFSGLGKAFEKIISC